MDVTWHRHADSEQFCLRLLDECSRRSPVVHRLRETMRQTATLRLLDWVDHFIMNRSSATEDQLVEHGFAWEEETGDTRLYHLPGALLPRIKVTVQVDAPLAGLALRVDRIADFLRANRLNGDIEGSPLAPVRRCLACREDDLELWAVERRGSRSIEPLDMPAGYAETVLTGIESWLVRPREGDDEELFLEAQSRAAALAAALGPDMAAHIMFTAERAVWEGRNRAARIQKTRQNHFGLGWSNHDHHTFRSSRRHLPRLVRLLETVGFHCRERFYAGEEAGWGAQVMENPRAGIALFLDIDLAPAELSQDFAHEPLAERDELGTVGLWCALHGDSILGAGLHHLAVHCDFASTRTTLPDHGVKVMEPFSTFPYLQQAFTTGERWPVDPARITRLIDEKRLDREKADLFMATGALGSHLELIQRGEGFKGFNQQTISDIISRTDPRRQE